MTNRAVVPAPIFRTLPPAEPISLESIVETNVTCNIFPLLGLNVYTTTFENSGDTKSVFSQEILGRRLWEINSENFLFKYLSIKGKFTFKLDAYEPMEINPGDMFPENNINYSMLMHQNIKITAETNNASYIVVSPFGSTEVISEKITIVPGDTYTINKGTFAVVIANSYILNGVELFENPKTLDCAANDAIVTTIAPGYIIKFTGTRDLPSGI